LLHSKSIAPSRPTCNCPFRPYQAGPPPPLVLLSGRAFSSAIRRSARWRGSSERACSSSVLLRSPSRLPSPNQRVQGGCSDLVMRL
jgi:hypothetical protein